MWIDSDAMIVDPAFEIPFHMFGGKDLVAWGNEEQLRAGDALAGACGPQWAAASRAISRSTQTRQRGALLHARPGSPNLPSQLRLSPFSMLRIPGKSPAAQHGTGAAATGARAARAGFNSGVMLFRRSKWTKEFLEAVADLGRVPEPQLGEVPAPLRLLLDDVFMHIAQLIRLSRS
jgi:hypothetical protein